MQSCFNYFQIDEKNITGVEDSTQSTILLSSHQQKVKIGIESKSTWKVKYAIDLWAICKYIWVKSHSLFLNLIQGSYFLSRLNCWITNKSKTTNS